ncbi:MAG: redoxin family protein [Isosphaeraceae bacterium]
MIAFLRSFIAIGFAWILTTQSAWAGSDPAVSLDPELRKLLEQFAGKYQRMQSYSDEGTVTLSTQINGKDSKESAPLKLTFLRPNKFKLCTGRIRLISDGGKLTSVVEPTQRFIEDKAPEAVTFATLRETPIGASILKGSTGVAPMVLLGLLTSADPVGEILEGTNQVKLMPTDRPGDFAVFVDHRSGPDVLMFIDKESFLLKEIVMDLEPGLVFGRIPKGVTVGHVMFRWTSGRISGEPPSAEQFAYQPPKEFTKVTTFAEAFSVGGETGGLVGKRSPDFTLSLIDETSLKKSDLVGKVALVVFWTTWSPPCYRQLESIQALVDRYKGKPVVVVAVNMDDEPTDVHQARKRIVDALHEKKLKLEEDPSFHLAYDPINSLGMAFHITSIPTTAILDQGGIVYKSYTGYLPETARILGTDIDRLLAPK